MKMWCLKCGSGFPLATLTRPLPTLCPACTAASYTNPKLPKKRARRSRRKKEPDDGTGSPT